MAGPAFIAARPVCRLAKWEAEEEGAEEEEEEEDGKVVAPHSTCCSTCPQGLT